MRGATHASIVSALLLVGRTVRGGSAPGWYASETPGLTCTEVCGNAILACDPAAMLQYNNEVDEAAKFVSLISRLTGGNPCTYDPVGTYGVAPDVPNYKANGDCFFSSPERTLDSVDCEAKNGEALRLCYCSLFNPPPAIPAPGAPPSHPRPIEAGGKAGDDPLFVGSDGVEYEVRGTPGVVFNLISAAPLSVNSRFLHVPQRFRAVDITDTVLGDVGVALCDDAGALRTLRFGAADGHLSLSTALEGGAAGEAGYVLEHTRLVCDLSAMACGWRQHDGTSLALPEYDGGHSRVKVFTASTNLSVTRNAMVDLGGDGAEQTEIDCDDFRAWPLAAAACARVMRGEASQEEMLMLVGPRLRTDQRFHVRHAAARTLAQLNSALPPPTHTHPPHSHTPLRSHTPTPLTPHPLGPQFMEVELPRLALQQPHVHGLLGQRALRRRDEGAAARRGGHNGSITPGAGGGGASAREAAAARFGSQGEGAIEGVYTEYIVGALGEHGSTRFNRFSHCREEEGEEVV